MRKKPLTKIEKIPDMKVRAEIPICWTFEGKGGGRKKTENCGKS